MKNLGEVWVKEVRKKAEEQKLTPNDLSKVVKALNQELTELTNLLRQEEIYEKLDQKMQ